MSPPATKQTTSLVCLSICAILIAIFGVLSTVGVLHKSATYDEPMHALAGYIHRQFGDYRMNFEDPPLWQRWAALSSERERLSPDFAIASWTGMAGNSYLQWQFTADTLFHGGAMNDGVSFISRTRAMMVPIGVALGVLIAAWAWRLAGPIAAVVAVALFAFDPNFIGHTPLVKNDVAMALMTAAVAAATWSVGRRVTGLNATVLAVLVGIAVNVKFSALLLGPIVLAMLVVRAIMPVPWPVFGMNSAGIARRLLSAVSICFGIALVSVIVIWATYGFRFAPTSDPSIKIHTGGILQEAITLGYRVAQPPPKPISPDADEPLAAAQTRLASINAELTRAWQQFESVDATRDGSSTELAAEAGNLRRGLAQLTPQLTELETAAANLIKNAPPPDVQSDSFKKQWNDARVVLANATNAARQAAWNIGLLEYWRKLPGKGPDAFSRLVVFALDGRLLPSPWLNGALFVHSRAQLRGSYLNGVSNTTGFWNYFPLAIWFKTPVVTLAIFAAAFVVGAWAVGNKVRDRAAWTAYWPVVCLLLPPAIYLTSAMTSNLNIGLRHILPIYPFLYVAAGVVAAYAAAMFRLRAVVPIAVAGGLLAIESIAAWPNGIAYFNFLNGGPRGGFRRLADSNLDWGQDLPALARWQVQHPTVPIALSYFGTADPAAYGVRAAILPVGPIPPEVRTNYVVAVSATHLQGVYDGEVYKDLRSTEPVAVLNGTIYLFDLENRFNLRPK